MFTSCAGLVIQQWPNEHLAVVYSPSLRTTHLISAASAMLLQELCSKRLTLQELALAWVPAEADQARFGVEATASLEAALTALAGVELISANH